MTTTPRINLFGICSRRLTAVFVFSLLLFYPFSVLAEVYEIDGSHSKVSFKVRHLGISNVVGNFKQFGGEFTFDKEKIAESKVEAKINVKSIDTDVEKRDKHLLSEDFLNEPKFPSLEFKSTKITGVSGDNFKIVGTLSLHGVSKEVVLDTTYSGGALDPWGNERVAFLAKTSIDRKDFGLTYNKLLETGGLVVGHEVKIEIEIEGIKKKK